MLRGAELYDVFMAMRFDREAAAAAGAWSLLCRMSANFRAADLRDRNGRPSWDDIKKIRARHPQLAFTLVGLNVAGVGRRRSAGRSAAGA
jgi:hypothetical protein